MRFAFLFLLGILSGALITIQSVVNAQLGKRTGYLGSVLILTVVSFVFLAVMIAGFPRTANLRGLPGLREWYLYAGGIVGVGIVIAPIFLVPRIGATSTLTALVVGQLVLALVVDHFGWFGVPKIGIDLNKLAGLALLAAGAFLISKR